MELRVEITLEDLMDQMGDSSMVFIDTAQYAYEIADELGWGRREAMELAENHMDAEDAVQVFGNCILDEFMVQHVINHFNIEVGVKLQDIPTLQLLEELKRRIEIVEQETGERVDG